MYGMFFHVLLRRTFVKKNLKNIQTLNKVFFPALAVAAGDPMMTSVGFHWFHCCFIFMEK